MAECAVCYEKFNEGRRKKIICPFDDCVCVPNKSYACKECTCTHILGLAHSACCMYCKKTWPREFLLNTFASSFIKQYDAQLQDLAFQTQLSLLPDTLVDVAILKRKRELKVQIEQYYRDIAETRRRILEKKELLESADGISKKVLYVLPCPRDGCRGFIEKEKWRCGLCNIKVCKECHTIKRPGHECVKEDIESAKAVQAETKPCPKCSSRIFKTKGCFGEDTEVLMYDGTVRKVQNIIIDDLVCGDDGLPRRVTRTFNDVDEMFEIYADESNRFTISLHHTLILWSVLEKRTVEMTLYEYILTDDDVSEELFLMRVDGSIMEFDVRESGYDIFYGFAVEGPNRTFLLANLIIVHNCHQMFCTICHTPFDWSTGKIIKGRFHNPEYTDYLRNNGGLTREVGDVPCGGLPTTSSLRWIFPFATFKNLYPIVPCIYARTDEVCNYIDHSCVPYDLKELRIKYLMGKMTMDKFKRTVAAKEKANLRKKEERVILDTFRTASIERFKNLVERAREYYEEFEVDIEESGLRWPSETRRLNHPVLKRRLNALSKKFTTEMEVLKDICNDGLIAANKKIGYSSARLINFDRPY